MKTKLILKTTLFLFISFLILNIAKAGEPVNKNASPEARALLDLYYRISGKYTLTGQHNYPNTKDRNSRFAKKYSGKTPVIWSTDMGFAKDGDTDSYLARPDIVREAIRQYKKGSLVTICWHAVPPTANEPVTFRPQRKMPPDSLNSVQGQLTDEQFKELLTPGTKLYNHWAQQVDSVAVYLKKLRDAHVPVLWRPYHEMNGDWFWWGGRVGKYSTIDLYKQLFDRLVNYHKLNNLVWLWNVDRPSTPIRKFSNFYPGDKYFDIASLDVYGSDFNPAYYDSLLVLAKGKPILFGEVGNPPTPEILKDQPKWASWVIWAGMVRNTSKKEYQKLYHSLRILCQEDPTYWKIVNPFRKACKLPLLPLKPKYPVDFSGTWVLNEDKSKPGRNGIGNVPAKMDIDQDDDEISVKKTVVVEWGDDRVTREDILLDGTEMKSQFFNSPRISTAGWDSSSNAVKINSTVTFNRNGHTFAMKSDETWNLQKKGKELKVVQTSTGFRGNANTAILIYDRE